MNVPTKIIEFKNLYLLRKKNAHKKIVLAHGTFDFFHYGHFLHLKKAKSFGDILVVSLTADKFVNKGPGRPFYQQKIRSDYLASLKFVDYIIIANFKTGIEVIKKLKLLKSSNSLSKTDSMSEGSNTPSSLASNNFMSKHMRSFRAVSKLLEFCNSPCCIIS